MNTQWDIVVIGGANTDFLVKGEHLPGPQEAAHGEVFLESPGGKGANQAVAAARLGACVALIARVGPDRRGRNIIDQLAAEGVDTRWMIRDESAPTGATLIMVDKKGKKQTISSPGANLLLSEADIKAIAPVISHSKLILTQLEIPLRSTEMAIKLAAGSNVQVILDPAPAIPLPNELLRLIDIIKPNSKEAEVLTRIPVHDRVSARIAAETLLWHGAQAAIVQGGESGNLLMWDEYEFWFPRIPVKQVDVTGAGDAFAGALAVAISEGRSLPEAVMFGSAAAALATTVLGAQRSLPRRDKIFDLVNQISSGKKFRLKDNAA